MKVIWLFWKNIGWLKIKTILLKLLPMPMINNSWIFSLGNYQNITKKFLTNSNFHQMLEHRFWNQRLLLIFRMQPMKKKKKNRLIDMWKNIINTWISTTLNQLKTLPSLLKLLKIYSPKTTHKFHFLKILKLTLKISSKKITEISNNLQILE